MDTRFLRRSAVKGLLTGLLFSQILLEAMEESSPAVSKEGQKKKSLMDLAASTGGNVTFHLLSEQELLIELNEAGAKLFRSLSQEGKALALKLASRSCNGTNECKGQNACRTDKNSCYGQGSCKGQTVCGFANKNDAVKLASDLMAKKRAEIKKS